MDKISVIVPVYNAESTIQRCIDSILRQSYDNLELILIDDGSTDQSPLLCDHYADIDNRVKVYHKENGGAASARNKGLEIITGRFLTFVDSDDYIEPVMYETLIEEMNGAGMIICNWVSHDNHNGEKRECGIGDGSQKDSDWTIQKITQSESGIGGYPWNKIIDCSHIKNLPRFNEQLTIYEDMVWVIEALKELNEVKTSAYRGYHYIIDGNSVSHKWSVVNCKSIIRAWDQVGEMVELDKISRTRRTNELVNVMWDLAKRGIPIREYWKNHKKIIQEDLTFLKLKQWIKIVLIHIKTCFA